MRMADLPDAPCRPLPVCSKHQRRTCYECLHSYNCDNHGCLVDEKVFAADTCRLRLPLQGANALFVPQLDTHLGLCAGIGSGSPERPQVEELYNEDGTFTLVTPPAMAPSEEWFHYCKECDLTWLMGHDGPAAAMSHPSHTTLRDKRTLVLWVAARVAEKVNQSRNPIGLVSFGSESTLNQVQQVSASDGPRAEQDSLIAAAISGLQKARTFIREQRKAILEKCVKTNSHYFSKMAETFRVLVVVSDPKLVGFVSSLNSHVTWKPITRTYRTRFGEGVPANAQAGSYEEMHSLEVELEALAVAGIFVKWYLVHPSLNKAVIQLASKETATDTSPQILNEKIMLEPEKNYRAGTSRDARNTTETDTMNNVYTSDGLLTERPPSSEGHVPVPKYTAPRLESTPVTLIPLKRKLDSVETVTADNTPKTGTLETSGMPFAVASASGEVEEKMSFSTTNPGKKPGIDAVAVQSNQMERTDTSTPDIIGRDAGQLQEQTSDQEEATTTDPKPTFPSSPKLTTSAWETA
ncbi:uncharacterized protein JN550_004028 [Neoarthrinium moseri]|uniref:uncharacterized protein n=1 Tax=Neoarthrinium moseri TaxID=1658444 RepID=UPI001FDDF166|nr:uncharacterized protein JN550_004028 [Neoarthrinium moseri]KAI1872309.1 hypothetical protein JN550_004028 [Neoarthrinium moseri]